MVTVFVCESLFPGRRLSFVEYLSCPSFHAQPVTFSPPSVPGKWPLVAHAWELRGEQQVDVSSSGLCEARVFGASGGGSLRERVASYGLP